MGTELDCRQGMWHQEVSESKHLQKHLFLLPLDGEGGFHVTFYLMASADIFSLQQSNLGDCMAYRVYSFSTMEHVLGFKKVPGAVSGHLLLVLRWTEMWKTTISLDIQDQLTILIS